MTSVETALKRLPSSVRNMLDEQCDGDWSRVSFEDGSFVVRNKPRPVAKPAKKAVAKKAPAKKAPAKRVPRKAPVKAVVESDEDRAKRLHAERITSVKASGQPDDTWLECEQLDIHDPHWVSNGDDWTACTGSGSWSMYVAPAFHPAPEPDLPGLPFEPPVEPVDTEIPAPKTEVPDPPKVSVPAYVAEPQPLMQPTRTIKVRPVDSATVDDAMLTAHSTTLLNFCRDGLPSGVGYTVKEDVMALYGIDLDLLDACLRNPERVEIRPESHAKDKRYCILGFNRGDLQVILGMRNPVTPAVIAAYATARLEADGHHVNYSGGGAGGARNKGLPKTSRQVVTRLRSMGGRELEVEIDPRQKVTEVVYKGQSLGMISCDGDRKTAETDYQRVARKMEAIDRRDR